MKSLTKSLALLLTLTAATAAAGGPEVGADPFAHVPAEAPRTWVLGDQRDEFRAFVRSPAGAAYFSRIKSDFDAQYLGKPPPEEPDTYGDPDPRKRTPEIVELWRAAQDVGNRLATIAEAATLIWLATGEDVYLDQAKEYLLAGVRWSQDGVSSIHYNDEVHFRLWRKLPMIYDQIRGHLGENERAEVVDSFRVRGERHMELIRSRRVQDLKRNSIEVNPASHAVRFMACTGIAALALWDEIPEARDWYRFAYEWYRDVFTPWGGDDGGWAEGVAYWRGVIEHGDFQDTLMLLDDPVAYGTDFWKNTGYFMVYFVMPHHTTHFGDLSNAGRFNMEPSVKHFVDHLARVLGDGYLASYAAQYTDPRPLPVEMGLDNLNRMYPTATEYLRREFVATRLEAPEPRPLSDLPNTRYFKDIGWVSMRSSVADPQEDIQLFFKSSPYGSFSHSHADQNAFILNAYGRNLAINSGYREYHRSKQHRFWTRQTKSKNLILIDQRGQDVQDKYATGEILRYETGDRYVWTTGEATTAYRTLETRKRIEEVRRDVVFIDNRYFVIRENVRVARPFMLSWLLHAMEEMDTDEANQSITISKEDAHLGVRLLPWDNSFLYRQWTGFSMPVDPDYVTEEGVAARPWLTAPNVDQWHFSAELNQAREHVVVFSVFWPTRDKGELERLHAELEAEDTLVVRRPDGQVDRITLDNNSFVIE